MELDDIKYARCKACDIPFYPVWLPHREVFEDLCHVCKPISIKAAFMVDDDEGESSFIDGYLIDKRDDSWID